MSLYEKKLKLSEAFIAQKDELAKKFLTISSQKDELFANKSAEIFDTTLKNLATQRNLENEEKEKYIEKLKEKYENYIKFLYKNNEDLKNENKMLKEKLKEKEEESVNEKKQNKTYINFNFKRSNKK